MISEVLARWLFPNAIKSARDAGAYEVRRNFDKMVREVGGFKVHFNTDTFSPQWLVKTPDGWFNRADPETSVHALIELSLGRAVRRREAGAP